MDREGSGTGSRHLITEIDGRSVTVDTKKRRLLLLGADKRVMGTFYPLT